jgi:hypothetical protein
MAALLVAGPAAAQLDPGNFDLVQEGRKVGEIFVPERAPGATTYVEHWVLFPDYVNPDPETRGATRIRRARVQDASEADFFRRVRFGPDFRYVRIDVTESDQREIISFL